MLHNLKNSSFMCNAINRSVESYTNEGLTIISGAAHSGKNLMMLGIIKSLPKEDCLVILTETNAEYSNLVEVGITRYQLFNEYQDETIEEILKDYYNFGGKARHIFIEQYTAYGCYKPSAIQNTVKHLTGLCKEYDINIYIGVHKRKGSGK